MEAMVMMVPFGERFDIGSCTHKYECTVYTITAVGASQIVLARVRIRLRLTADVAATAAAASCLLLSRVVWETQSI